MDVADDHTPASNSNISAINFIDSENTTAAEDSRETTNAMNPMTATDREYNLFSVAMDNGGNPYSSGQGFVDLCEDGNVQQDERGEEEQQEDDEEEAYEPKQNESSDEDDIVVARRGKRQRTQRFTLNMGSDSDNEEE